MQLWHRLLSKLLLCRLGWTAVTNGNCHCHEGPYMVWQNVGNDIGSRAILLAVSLEVFQGQKLDRFNLVVITNSRLEVRVSYQLAWPEVFWTRAFCTGSCHGCCWPPQSDHVQSTGSKYAGRVFAPQTTRCPENVSWVAPTVRRIKAPFQYKIHSVYIYNNTYNQRSTSNLSKSQYPCTPADFHL